MDTVIFHRDCPDGFCAAFIAKRRYPTAEIVSATYGEEPPYQYITNKDVLIVDFSWKRQEMLQILDKAKSLQVFDHHVTAQQELTGLDCATFDMSRSGATLTWDILFGGNRPWYVNYVEDRDLWRFSLPDSKAISAFIMAIPYTIAAWTELDRMRVQDAVIAGKAIRLHIDQYIEKVVAQRQIGILNGHSVAVVNAAYPNISDVCNVLCQHADIGCGWFERGDGCIQVSLRSVGPLDVSTIAASYGGGGHKNAAGFQLPKNRARGVIDQILDSTS